MTKQEAHRLLHQWAHFAKEEQGWEVGDFLFNFEQAWGHAPQNVTDAAEMVPEALEHIAQVVWYPTRRDI